VNGWEMMEIRRSIMKCGAGFRIPSNDAHKKIEEKGIAVGRELVYCSFC